MNQSIDNVDYSNEVAWCDGWCDVWCDAWCDVWCDVMWHDVICDITVSDFVTFWLDYDISYFVGSL